MTGFVQNGPTAVITTGILQPTITLVTAGNGLIAKYSVDAINAVIAPPTDSAGQTWQTRSTFANAGGSGGIFYLLNANAGTHTLSFATRAGAQQGGIEEANGLIGPGGTAVSNSVTAATITSPTYTPLGNEYVCAQMFETGTTTPDNIHCNTAAFQSIGTLSDSTPKPCTMINQNGTTQSGVEANSAILSAPTSVTWAWTGSVFAFSMVAGFTLASGGVAIAQGQGPGRSPGRTSARFQQLKLSTVNPGSFASGTFNGAGVSAAVFPLTATGLLAFTGSSASSASFGLSASIAFSGSSASSAIVPVSGGIGIVGSSASSANFAPSVNIGFTGVSASTASFSLLGSGVVAVTGTSASGALFNATPVGLGSSFAGSSASTATFDLSASAGLLAFRGASASAAVLDTSGSIGLLSFNGVSASIAVVDVEPLSAGSISFFGASASAATITLTGPFTPPDVVPPPTGALLPGVAPKTAIELERGFKYPWQATGAPIVPSPYMGSSEALVPLAPIIAPQIQAEPVIVPTEDEALLLLLLLGASL